MSVRRSLPVALACLAIAACDVGGRAPVDPAGESVPARAGDRDTPPGNVFVVLLGTGTPIPQPDRSGPATAVIAWGRAYLVDLGRGVLLQARRAQIAGVEALDPRRLALAFLTHLHSDHVTGYPDVLMTPPILGREEPLRVFGPPGTRAMTDHLYAAFALDFEMRPGLRGRERAQIVEAVDVMPGRVYADAYVEVTAFAVRHPDWAHAYGYRFDTPERSIVISGDTAPAQSVIDACNGCDVLVHEVYCREGMSGVVPPGEIWDYNARAHTSAEELGELAAAARPAKLVLTHRIDYGCSIERMVELVRGSFDGEIVVGSDLSIH